MWRVDNLRRILCAPARRRMPNLCFEKDQRVRSHRANLAGIAVSERPIVVLAEIDLSPIHSAKIIGTQQARLPIFSHLPDAMLPPDTLVPISPGPRPFYIQQLAALQLCPAHALLP